MTTLMIIIATVRVLALMATEIDIGANCMVIIIITKKAKPNAYENVSIYYSDEFGNHIFGYDGN